MQNLTVHLARPPRFLLGPAHARPCARRTSPLSLPPGPAHVGTSAPLCEQRRAARARRVRVTAGRDTVGAPPAGRGQAPRPPPHHVAPPRPDPLLLSFFPLSHAVDRARSKARPTHHPSTPSSPTPLRSPSRAPPPSPPFSCLDCCLRPAEASPSRRIFAEHRRCPPPPLRSFFP
jgi:hypothetical protein